MTPQKNIALEPELFNRVSEEARKDGVAPDDLANEAMKRFLALRRLDSLQRYGKRRADELGLTEADIPGIAPGSRTASGR